MAIREINRIFKYGFKNRSYFLFLVLFLCHILMTYETVASDVIVGGNFSILQNQHELDFMELPGISNCCTNYNSTTSRGIMSKIFLEIAVLPIVDIRLNLGYSRIGADLRAEEFIGNTEYNNDINPVYTIHNLETDIDILTLQPEISFIPLNEYPLRINAGLETGLMLSKNYYQHEDLNQDDISKGIIFYDGENSVGTSRNESNGEIPEALLYHAITVGLAYDINISHNFILRPEFAYYNNIKNIVATKFWRINKTAFGISVAYQFSSDKEELIAYDQNDLVEEDNAKSKYIETSEEKSTINENNDGNENKDGCCFIIFTSSRDKDHSLSILKSIREKSNEKVFIEEWTNPFSGILYYRIRSACFASTEKAFNFKQLINFNDSNEENAPVIKCK